MIESEVTLLPQPDSPTSPSDLARVHREIHAVHGLDDAVFGEEIGLEVFDFQ